MYFWGQKYQKPPHDVFRGIARSAALHGARKIKPMRHPVADAPQPAPSFSASNESAELLCRHGRHCLYMAMRPGSLYQLTFPEISIRQCVSLFSARRSPTWFRWRESGRKAESASGGDGLLANPRIVARRRFQPFGRRHRNRSGGFCCFSPPKSREKSFLCTFGAKSTKSLRTSFSAGVREPRRCTGRARSGLCATPWRTRRSSPPLFPRQTRVRIYCAANGGIFYSIWQCTQAFFSRKAIPDLVPMAEKRTED